MIPASKQGTVSEAPGDGWRTFAGRKPMIRLSNHLLVLCGFTVGTRVAVRYDRDTVTITRMRKTYDSITRKP